MNESGHAQLRLLETAAFFRLRSNSEKFRNHCVHASSLDLKRAVLKSREGTPVKMRRTSEPQNRRIETSLVISVMAKLGYAELRVAMMPPAEACDLKPCFAAI